MTGSEDPLQAALWCAWWIVQCRTMSNGGRADGPVMGEIDTMVELAIITESLWQQRRPRRCV